MLSGTLFPFTLSKLGGLNFFLVCNYNIDKIPVKMSAFHRQAFLSWSLIFKHNFSPHNYQAIYGTTRTFYLNTNPFLLSIGLIITLYMWLNYSTGMVFSIRIMSFYLYIISLYHLQILPEFLEQSHLEFACYLDLNLEWKPNISPCYPCQTPQQVKLVWPVTMGKITN